MRDCTCSGGSSNAQQPAPSDDQPELFERIEAAKLQEAVSNASAMGQLQVHPCTYVRYSLIVGADICNVYLESGG